MAAFDIVRLLYNKIERDEHKDERCENMCEDAEEDGEGDESGGRSVSGECETGLGVAHGGGQRKDYDEVDVHELVGAQARVKRVQNSHAHRLD